MRLTTSAPSLASPANHSPPKTGHYRQTAPKCKTICKPSIHNHVSGSLAQVPGLAGFLGEHHH
jgi:hypothetical protein